MSESSAVVRMLRGHRAAATRQRELTRLVGPQPEQAIAEAISATTALAAQGAWPRPRDPVAERAVGGVRQRWVRIARNVKHTRQG